MKKPKKKANKLAEQPKKPIEPAVQTAEEVQDAPKTIGKFRIPRRLRAWIRESQFLATTLSIILTFGTTGLVEYCQRVKDRKMSAIMVLSTIENFSTTVDLKAQGIARCDSIGHKIHSTKLSQKRWLASSTRCSRSLIICPMTRPPRTSSATVLRPGKTWVTATMGSSRVWEQASPR